MTEHEYEKKMRDLGYSEEYISESLQLRAEAEKNNIKIPYDIDLIELPVKHQ